MKNIVLFGRMGSGKTTAASYLVSQYGYVRLCLADPVKEIAVSVFDMKSKDRKLLQTIGKVGRAIDNNTWINKLTSKIEVGKNYVVDDCRFQNELEALVGLNFVPIFIDSDLDTRVIRLFNSYGHVDSDELDDVSEKSIDSLLVGCKAVHMYDIHNDGYISGLYEQIDDVLLEINNNV